MIDNFNNILDVYNHLKANPQQTLSRCFNVPQNISNPNDILQHLLNTGQVSQENLNRIVSMKNSPLVQRLINGR